MGEQNRYPSKERVYSEDGRLKYPVGFPIPASDVDTLVAQGYVSKGDAEQAAADAQTAAQRDDRQTATGAVLARSTGDGAVAGGGRAPGEPSPEGNTQPPTADQVAAASDGDTGTASSAAYDPSGYSVDDVNAYLEANPDQRDAVLAAERDGKARKGILGDS